MLERRVALAEWLRRVPAKYMGFSRESSNLSGDEVFFPYLNQNPEDGKAFAEAN